MNDDDLDLAIRETQHRYAGKVQSTRDPVPAVFLRVQRTRRRRRTFTTLAAAAVTAAVIGGVALGTDLPPGGDTTDHNIAGGSSTPTPSTSPTAPSTSATPPGEPRTLADALRTQLTANAAVAHRLGRGQRSAVLLCTTHVFGAARSHQHLYVYIVCGRYSTGPNARLINGAGDPALLTVKGSGAHTKVVAVKFPRLAYYSQDIAAMFPLHIASEMAARQFQMDPTEGRLLAEARQLDPQ